MCHIVRSAWERKYLGVRCYRHACWLVEVYRPWAKCWSGRYAQVKVMSSSSLDSSFYYRCPRSNQATLQWNCSTWAITASSDWPSFDSPQPSLLSCSYSYSTLFPSVGCSWNQPHLTCSHSKSSWYSARSDFSILDRHQSSYPPCLISAWSNG